jgi:hypothetical protein
MRGLSRWTTKAARPHAPDAARIFVIGGTQISNINVATRAAKKI